jgi:hypothetical protein
VYYKQVDKSHDYNLFITATLSQQQARAIKTENKFTTLNDKDIESWHKKFMETQYVTKISDLYSCIQSYSFSPSGELNEEDFINEFQKLYPL